MKRCEECTYWRGGNEEVGLCVLTRRVTGYSHFCSRYENELNDEEEENKNE